MQHLYDKKTKLKNIQNRPFMLLSDKQIINTKLQQANIVPNILIIILTSFLIFCSALLIAHYIDIGHREEDMTQLANTYSTVDTSNYPPVIDFDSLKAVNEDVAGWIYMPNTHVNYPIMSNEEQNKYLRKDMYENYSMLGSIFMDSHNNPDFKDDHIVMYGHHMPTEVMFTPVSNYYTDPEYKNEHPYIYIITPETTYKISCFGAYKVDPSHGSTVNVYYNNETEFQHDLDEHISECDSIDENTFHRPTTDKLFTLVTCADNGSARAIIECTITEQYPTKYNSLIREQNGLDTQHSLTDEELKQEQDKVRTSKVEDMPIIATLNDIYAEITSFLDR